MPAGKKLTSEKKDLIGNIIEMYDIKTMSDIQNAMKDLISYIRRTTPAA